MHANENRILRANPFIKKNKIHLHKPTFVARSPLKIRLFRTTTRGVTHKNMGIKH